MTVAANGAHTAPSLPVVDVTPETPAPAVPEWIRDQAFHVRDTLGALHYLLAGIAPSDTGPETFDRFADRVLGIRPRDPRAAEIEPLTPVSRISCGLALTEFIAAHAADAEIGPHERALPPAWKTDEIVRGEEIRLPHRLSVGFPAGTLTTEPVVIRFTGQGGYDGLEMEAVAGPGGEQTALAAIAAIKTRAAELNPYRGRWLTVSMAPTGKLRFTVEVPPILGRTDVVASDEIWDELDLNARAVAGDHGRLSEAGLGARRGVMLAGPPGTGKSALSAVVAHGLHRDHAFTVMYAGARAGANCLTQIMRHARELAPVVVVLEDVDLYVHGRSGVSGTQGLSELLAAMDDAPTARILTIATSNDPAGLKDAAAIRNGRFDALVEVNHPDRDAVASLLRTFTRAVPDVGEIDFDAVAAMVPKSTPGASIREIVRRAVLSGSVTTVSLGNVVKAGRWRPQAPKAGGGQYL